MIDLNFGDRMKMIRIYFDITQRGIQRIFFKRTGSLTCIVAAFMFFINFLLMY